MTTFDEIYNISASSSTKDLLSVLLTLLVGHHEKHPACKKFEQ